MKIIKVIYDNGSNGLVKLHREAKKNHKRIADMTTQKIMQTGFGMFR